MPWLLWGVCVCASFAVTISLTSKGVVGSDDYDDMTGVPCKCRGIAGGGKAVEADWLLFVSMSLVAKWLVYKPIVLLLATCLHLQAANRRAMRNERKSDSKRKKANDSKDSTNLTAKGYTVKIELTRTCTDTGEFQVNNPMENSSWVKPVRSVGPDDARSDGGGDKMDVAVDEFDPGLRGSWAVSVASGGEGSDDDGPDVSDDVMTPVAVEVAGHGQPRGRMGGGRIVSHASSRVVHEEHGFDGSFTQSSVANAVGGNDGVRGSDVSCSVIKPAAAVLPDTVHTGDGTEHSGPDWQLVADPATGHGYYYNAVTGETCWA